MLVRRAIAPVLLLAAAYVAAPYVTVWRLAGALQHADVALLDRLIDWPAVRAGLKDDINDGIMGVHRPSLGDAARPIESGDSLPPFGASFVTGIAGNVVDHDVTPEHLAAAIRQTPVRDETPVAPGIRRAYFDGPASFEIEVRCPGQDADDEPLRLRLAISGGSWKVVRAWIPQDLVDEANSRT